MQKLIKSSLLALLAAASASLSAAPVGYSINSDSGSANADSLYRIDLGAGSETRIGTVTSFGETRIDVEGLAFAPDGTLYGIDDASMTLFPINPNTGAVQTSEEVAISGLPRGGGNDFGMTFACDDKLYVTSIAERSLYQMGLDGSTSKVADLSVKISALAAYGNPVRLYGLGNGLDGNLNQDSPYLYEIDINDGSVTEIGALVPAAGLYSEGGLAFDDSGQLWAITDRRPLDQVSQVMMIDTITGAVSGLKNLSESGFESLAVTVPRGCATGGGNNALFKVQKSFEDGNDQLATTLNIRCKSGLPLEQSIEVLPNSGALGNYEVTFTVTDFTDGALDCEIWESTPADYYASYECFSDGSCSSSATACSFTGTARGQDNLCVIRNYPEFVEVAVSAEWIYGAVEEAQQKSDKVLVELYCRNVITGDGDWTSDGMRWSWEFTSEATAQAASIQPRHDLKAECRTDQTPSASALESVSSCADWTPASTGLDCLITNTAFFEGIPALNRGGLIIAALLLLMTGLVFVRRF